MYGNGYNQNYGRQAFQPRNNFNRNFQGMQYQKPMKKHSGCKKGVGKNQATYIQGWNYSRRNGLTSLIASPRKDGKTCVNQKGEQLTLMVCKITRQGQLPQLCTGFWNPNVNKLRIPDLGMTANPQAPNGGYFGKTAVSRNRR